MNRLPEKKEKKRKSHWLERLLYLPLSPLFRFLFRIRVIGLENIPKEGGCVVCSNHVALQDVLVLSAAFPRDKMPKYMAKAELFRIPVLRRLIRALGAIPLDRGGSDVGAIHRAVELAAEGEMVTVFPQGTRQKGKNPADTPIKHGAALIAARAGVPLLPVCIAMKNQRYAPFRRTYVLIGPPLSPEDAGLTKDGRDYRAAAEIVFARVCALGGFTAGAALPDAKQLAKEAENHPAGSDGGNAP